MRQRHESRFLESDSATESVDPDELTPGSLVGSDLQRREDAHLLTGETSYLDDIEYPGTVYLALVRSQYANADVGGVDASNALDRDGVLAVYTAEDLAAAGIDEGMATDSPDQGVAPSYPVLVQDRVRYQGQPVAAVVATDRYLAHDAVQDVVVEYDRHDAVTDLDRAQDPTAPAVHEAAPDNVAFEWAVGDEDAVEAAFASADRTVDLELVNNRLMPLAMATQAAVARYRSADDELVVDVGSQKPHGTRSTLARILALPEHRIDVRVPDVSGAFGGKLRLYPGHVLAAWGAMQLERPVKWIGTRVGDSVDTSHSRHQHVEAEAALDADGAIAGVRANIQRERRRLPHSRRLGRPEQHRPDDLWSVRYPRGLRAVDGRVHEHDAPVCLPRGRSPRSGVHHRTPGERSRPGDGAGSGGLPSPKLSFARAVPPRNADRVHLRQR
jgi:carbon-monoxide dehydrogenase large subunit